MILPVSPGGVLDDVCPLVSALLVQLETGGYLRARGAWS